MDGNHYLSQETYDALVAALADPAKLQDFDVFDVVNAVKHALGEIGGIFPNSIRDDDVEFSDDPEG